MIINYLAQPYSCNPEQAYLDALHYVGTSFAFGIMVYSPIIHNHPIAKLTNNPTDFHYWKDFDLSMLQRCDQLLVLDAPGWENSFGVKEEIAFAKTHKIPIKHVLYECAK